MAIQQPSQYQVDNMHKGDIVYVCKRNIFYRIYRHLFKNCPKIKVKKYPGTTQFVTYEYYQEDCTLLYEWEVVCVQTYDNKVPVRISVNNPLNTSKVVTLKSLQIGLYNVMLQFKNDTILTIPIDYFNDGIIKNKNNLKMIEDQRMIEDLIKYQKYKGSYFKKYVKDNNISEWTCAYCSVCGKPVIYHFADDNISVENQCNCGELKFEKTLLNYDEFSMWYTNQVNPTVRKRYDEFWFKKE